jgi:hypothetical protein
MKRAIEVLIDGERVGLLQARGGNPVGVSVGNIPRDHMRVWATGSDDTETWYWQMPDVADGQMVSFRVVEIEDNEISKPYQIEKRDPEEVAENKRIAKEMYKKAMQEKADSE